MGGRSESKGGIRRSVAFCCSEMLRKCADKWKQDCVQAYFGRALVAASDSSLRRLLHSVCVASTLCVVVVVVVADACAPPATYTHAQITRVAPRRALARRWSGP